MSDYQLLASTSRYLELLGKDQALRLMHLFSEIENCKYQKDEVSEIKMLGFHHPLYLRSIRADMQSFINTFIEPYLDKKPFLTDAKFVIDAGANIGYTAVLFANWWPEARIISIEPDKENYELTLKNTAAYPNVTVLHGGLWSEAAALKIEAGQEDGFVLRPITQNDSNIKPENKVTGISIGQLLKDYHADSIDFLKMNIEGSEKDIFTDRYQYWLPRTKAMLIELHDGKNSGCSKAVFSAVSEYDFAVSETAPYGVLFTKESVFRAWYAGWYKEEIYKPNIDKERFPNFYLDNE